MKKITIMVVSKRKMKRNILLVIFCTISVYFLISLYFINHFFFNTEINGVNVSLKSHNKVSTYINRYINDYELHLLERNERNEVITSQDIDMGYNMNNSIATIYKKQNPFLWIGSSLFKRNKYYLHDLYLYDYERLEAKIYSLKCLNENIIEPQNVNFTYINGAYEVIDEVYGNKIKEQHLINAIHFYILSGKTLLDLNKTQCYQNPKFTVDSEKTLVTLNLLNQYVSSKIIYWFGNAAEQLDGTTINQWLTVDKNLDIIINKQAVSNYVSSLCKKYNTIGITREFLSSTGKRIQLKSGLYGWKINDYAETEALLQHIKSGDVIEKEPIYTQEAATREGNEIGNTYVEINITKQTLWFYMDGSLVITGPIVTGNPYRGHATVQGVYMINYKQKGVTLTGPDYEAKVTYWMPFFGDQGLHDATWRSKFGGEIYKRRGSHGCVNLPPYIAKTIYEHIEEGTPVIIYEE